MSNRHHRGRTTPKGTRPPARSAHRESRRSSLVEEAEARFRERSPFGLLAMASGLIEATTTRPVDSWGRERVQRPDGPSTFESFAASGWPAMEALALAVAALHPDDLLASRLRAALDGADVASGANWLSTMGTIEVTDTVVHGDPLGDGENVMVSWRWPDGQAATAVVYVDHNMGTIVKDAFVVPEDAATLQATYERLGDAQISVAPLDPADARERIVEAISSGERVVPPLANDTWPACRPMIEWVIGQLPAGGIGYMFPDWSQAARNQLVDDFLQSRHAKIADLSPGDVRGLLEPLLGFACDYGPGDPLRWSPVSVEIVLVDWYPRKVFGLRDDELRRVPDVLAGLVRFAHERRSIPIDLTAEALAAVDRWRGEFAKAAARPGRSPDANALRLARIAAGFDPDDFDEDGSNQTEGMAGVVADLEARVVAEVGGRSAFETLNNTPLTDVAFEWSAVPSGLRELTGQTLEYVDRWAIQLFDPEVRTIARRVLAGVIVADPGVFSRSARPDALAVAILSFLLGRLAGGYSAQRRRQFPWAVFTQRDLAAATGVAASTIGSRTRTVAGAVERADIDWSAFLHSTERTRLLRSKELVADWRRDHPDAS